MSTSERSFNQVKAILRKLDRSISEARERRTQAPPAAPTPARPPGASGYGRATPLPPGRTGGSSLQRWDN
ncbi:MAG: hypothetical protein IT437_07205 [Phycisphaerales bacterium]|nr:hypothetical protein [Phycisphaerales bacterium]